MSELKNETEQKLYERRFLFLCCSGSDKTEMGDGAVTHGARLGMSARLRNRFPGFRVFPPGLFFVCVELMGKEETLRVASRIRLLPCQP